MHLQTGQINADSARRSQKKDGEQKHGLSVVADKVLTVYAAGKARKAAQDAEGVPANVDNWQKNAA